MYFIRIYKELEAQVAEIFNATEISGVQALGSRQNFQDSLSRIGLFKSGTESQRQIQKASLGQLKAIARQTKGLKKSVEEA